ncbi:hypothetical protein JL107_18305 [Nakamurella flavida]|uniref:Uncharacterized protein n=1 Tax=Nakamurella flavida TaxID=363630 RepID=A0A939C4P5_9ACTN|nr:hypothetical protein [Nakamurella flavida]MBM9475934.1 hypothetical protein [Nakamurella flavida]MBM9478406.1 hypothetical protein [Nakamurella flavida]MDP9777779.1 hypothetical protein [Nakamurella flavida]
MSDHPQVPVSARRPAVADPGPAGPVTPVALGVGLLVAAVVGAAAPLIGVVGAADGSVVGGTTAAGWIAILPAVLVLVLAGGRRVPALAVAAGAGSFAVVRLVTDLPLVLGPDDLVRPDLFAETSDAARPFTVGAGAFLVLLADLLALVVGVLAARALAAAPMPDAALPGTALPGAALPGTALPDTALPDRALRDGQRPDRSGTAAGGHVAPGPAAGSTNTSGVRRTSPDGAGRPAVDRSPIDGDGGGAGPAARFGSGAEPMPPLRLAGNAPMIAVGCLGAVVVAAGLLSVPYRGGYLELRLVPAATDLSGVLAAFVALLALAVAVLVAAGVPRAVSAGLLAGAGLAAALPGLIAIVAVTAGAATSLSAAAFLPMVGGALVGASAALNRLRPTSTYTSQPVDLPANGRGDDSVAPPAGGPRADGSSPAARATPPRTAERGAAGPDGGRIGSRGSIVVGGLLLAAAAGCLLAWRRPILLFDGAAPTPEVADIAAPAAPPFLMAAIVLAVAGVLALLPWTAQAGRTSAGVVWAGALLALTDAGVLLARLIRAAGNTQDPLSSLMAAVPAEFKHTWSAGPGFWAGVAGVVLAAAAAVLAPVITRRVAEQSLLQVDDASADRSRVIRRGPLAVLVVLIVGAGAFPVWTADLTRSTALLRGYEVGTLGVWAVTLAAVGAVLLGGTSLKPVVAAAAPVAAAVVLAQRCLVPAAIRDEAGFATGPGLVAGVVAVVGLLLVAPLFWRAARRVRRLDPADRDVPAAS